MQIHLFVIIFPRGLCCQLFLVFVKYMNFHGCIKFTPQYVYMVRIRQLLSSRAVGREIVYRWVCYFIHRWHYQSYVFSVVQLIHQRDKEGRVHPVCWFGKAHVLFIYFLVGKTWKKQLSDRFRIPRLCPWLQLYIGYDSWACHPTLRL